MSLIRVRQAMNDTKFRMKVFHKIPKKFKTPPQVSRVAYPAFVKSLPNTYSDLGVMTELLLRYQDDVTPSIVAIAIRKLFNVELDAKNLTLRSMEDYVSRVNTTRALLLSLYGDEQPMYDIELQRNNTCIIGHPDIFTRTQIFEVKTSGNIKTEWNYFLVQLFLYAALATTQPSTIHLVLPLSTMIYTIDVAGDPETKARVDVISTEVLQSFTPIYRSLDQISFGSRIQGLYPIGNHILKQKSLAATVAQIAGDSRAFQFFLSSNTRIVTDDEDIATAGKLIRSSNSKLYFHAPYLLNLCIAPGDRDDYVVKCLQDHIKIGARMGIKGVVVHVGKSTSQKLEDAIANFKANIARVVSIPEASICKLLLETPAGQGTETLSVIDDFISFVNETDKNLGVCIDTCHVFALGYHPDQYLSRVIDSNIRKRIALIHYNDSSEDFGSRKDRHARIGCGKISHESLEKCAQLGMMYGIDMLHE